MTKVILLSPPFVKYYMRNARCDFVSLSKSQWYPLWLGYLGGFLEQKGYQVRLIDAPAYGLDHAATESLVLDFKPDLLVVYPGRLSEDNDVAFADRLVGRLGIPGVFVGPYASINPRQILQKSSCLNLAVQGEFEYPVLDILQGTPPQDIPNLVYKEEGEIKANPSRALLSGVELDQFPFVSEFFSRHLDYKYYRTPSELYPFMDLLSGRGCVWGRCTYCLWVHTFIKGPVYNARSPENLAEEFRFIQQRMPHVRSVMIQDDTLTDDRCASLADALLQAGSTLSWSCYVRGNLSYDTMKLMQRAGCRNLHVGFESASPQILQNIRKGLSVERMTRFAQEAQQAGLRLHGDFALGFPGETRQTAEATIAWACQLRPHTAQFQLMIPFPGTPFYEELSAKGQLVDGCPSYPELDHAALERYAKLAYRKYYLSAWFVKQLLKNPYEMLLSRVETYWRAVPAVFWAKYVR